MRLADFILANIEPILAEWEAFARDIWPGGVQTDPAELRDDAEEMLRAAVADMKSAQTALQQSDKSKGKGGDGPESAGVNRASVSHGVGRGTSGFDLASLIAEYRALRASVIRLWRESKPIPDTNDLADLTRFNESIDQSLSGAVLAYTGQVDQERQETFGELEKRERRLREMNEALLVSAVRQQELGEQAQQAEAEQRQSEQRYRTIVEQVRDYAIFSTDPQGRATSWNQGVRRILGFEEREFVGLVITHAIFTPEDIASGVPERELEEAARTGTANNDRWMRRRSGEYFFASGVTSALRDEEGQLVGFTKVMRDQTELKNFEREREALLANEQASRLEADAANRTKDVFLATLSHELRTPLNAILGWSQILSTTTPGAEEFQEAAEAIERNARAQAKLIEDVLDVSRIVSGKIRLEMRRCDLARILASAVEAVRVAADAKHIQLLTEIDPLAREFSGDAARIQQVVWNLLSNAIKFTPKDGKVTLSLRREQSVTRIAVADTGQGIDPAFLPHVFERFRQADDRTKRRFGGLGLGLSIVRHLVELHGGTVSAHSEGEGRGASFVVELPIPALHMDDPEEEPREAGDGEADRHSLPLVRLDGLRVLVVDDEPDARQLLHKILQSAGASVTAAASGSDAIELLGKAHPHVLVSDLGMPGMDGYELIQAIRSEGHSARELPAVALTAFAQRDYQRRAILSGYQVHMPKPVDTHDLTAVIASLAGRTGGS